MRKSTKGRKTKLIFAFLMTFCFTALFSWQIMNMIHVFRKGVPFELYAFFRSRKLIDNLQIVEELKSEGRDANYAYLFEYNETAGKIIEESVNSKGWRMFPLDSTVLRRENTFYHGTICIPYGWAGFIDELPISETEFNGFWIYIDKMKTETDGTAILIIDDKSANHLIYIESVW